MTLTAAASSTFTCASCRVIFTNIDEQRLHYQSEWHRYNLRRKVGDLPPVTEQAYTSKISTASASQTASILAVEEASKSRECVPCRKTFASAAAFDNHLNSRKHQELFAKFQQNGPSTAAVRVFEQESPVMKKDALSEILLPEDATAAQIDAAIDTHMAGSKDRLELSDCLYCPSHFESMEKCIEHMHMSHSFYIPDIDYLKDLPGLMRFLADKVSVWHVCLSCGNENRQPFQSLESVRRHMLDKGHNKIRFDDEGSAEIYDFFDYSKLNNNAAANDSDYDSDDFTSDEEEDGELGGFEENALILAPDESELILPNGSRIGSRVYRRYYRQNLIPYLDTESRPNCLRQVNEPRPDGTVVRGQHYVPPPRVISEVEKRDRKEEQRAQKTFALRMGVKGNGLQTYYREQLLQ